MSLSFQVGKSCFTDKPDRTGGKACEFGQVSHKRVERPAKLIFRRTANGDARQLGLDACAVSRNDGRDCFARQQLSPALPLMSERPHITTREDSDTTREDSDRNRIQ